MMKRLIATASAIALSGVAGSVAAEDVRGVVKSVDEVKNQITLMNGEVFALGMKPFSGQLNVGDVLDISWYTHEGGHKLAFDVDVVISAIDKEKSTATLIPQGETTRGVVQAIDKAKNTITLANGDVFAIGVAPHSSELVRGDIVQVKWYRYDSGGYKRAYKLERVHAIPIDRNKQLVTVTMGAKIDGKIANVNAALNLITLDSGATFALGTTTGRHASSLKQGQKVKLDWDRWHNGYRLANELKVIEN